MTAVESGERCWNVGGTSCGWKVRVSASSQCGKGVGFVHPFGIYAPRSQACPPFPLLTIATLLLPHSQVVFFSHICSWYSLCVLSLSLPPALFWWTCSGNFPTTAAAPTASAVRHTTAPSFEKNDLVKVEGKGAAASLGRRNAKVLSNGPDSDCEVHIQFLDNGMQDWVKANWVTESNRQKQAHR
jgi:hypothetical protein